MTHYLDDQNDNIIGDVLEIVGLYNINKTSFDCNNNYMIIIKIQ